MKLKDLKELPLKGAIVLYDGNSTSILTVINQDKDKDGVIYKPPTEELGDMEITRIDAGYKYCQKHKYVSVQDFYPAVFIGLDIQNKDEEWFKQWRN